MKVNPLHMSIEQKLKQVSDSFHPYTHKGHKDILNKWSLLLSDEEVLYINTTKDTFSLLLELAIQDRVALIAVEEMFT